MNYYYKLTNTYTIALAYIHFQLHNINNQRT